MVFMLLLVFPCCTNLGMVVLPLWPTMKSVAVKVVGPVWSTIVAMEKGGGGAK